MDTIKEPRSNDDREVSPLGRGIALTGAVTTALALPSIRDTFNKYYPKGIDSFLNRTIRSKPTETELLNSITRTIFNQTADISNILRNNMSVKPVIFDPKYDTHESTWDVLQKQRKLQNFKLKYKGENSQIEHLESMIYTAGHEVSPTHNTEVLQAYKKEAIAKYIEIKGEAAVLAEYPLMTSFIQNMKLGNMTKTSDVNTVFSTLITKGDSTLLKDVYKQTLEYGSVDNTSIMATRSRIVKLLDKPSQHRGTFDFTLPKMVNAPLIEIHSAKYKNADIFANEFFASINPHIEWSKDNLVQGYDLKFKRAIKEFYNEVHGEGLRHNGNASSFSIRLTSTHMNSSAMDKLEICSINRKGGKQALYLDLPVKGNLRGGDRIPQATIMGDKGFNPKNILATQVDGFALHTKTFANAIVNESRGLAEVRNVQRMFNTQYKTMELSSGNDAIDSAKRTIVTRKDMPWLNESSSRLKQRASGLLDYHLLNHVKNTGQDVLIYDTEFYSGRAGTQALVKTPQSARLYQISYRRVSSTGQVLQQGNHYIKDASFDRLYTAYTSGTPSIELANLKHVLARTGHGNDPEYLHELIMKIKNEGVDPKKALNSVFNEAGKGAVILDMAGKGGSDRALIDYINPSLLKNRTMVDILQLQKSASSLSSGFRLTQMFTRMVENADEVELNNIVETMSSHSSTNAHSKLIHKLGKMKNVKDRRERIIHAVTADSHDSSVDVAVTHTVLNNMMRDRAQMGHILGFSNMLQKIMNSGHIDYKTRINMLKYAQLSTHFNGNGEDEAFYMATIPNAVSTGGMLKGNSQMFNYARMDPLNVQDSSLRQIHQQLNGTRMTYLGKHGHFLDPYTTAFRMNQDRLASNLSENIAAHSEPVMVPMLLVSKSTGLLGDDAVMLEQDVLDRSATLYRHREKRVSFKGLKKESELARTFDFLYKKKGINIFEDHTVDTDELNLLLDEHFKQRNDAVGEAWMDSKANITDLKKDFYRYEQDTVIAKTTSGIDVKSKHLGNTRLVKVRLEPGSSGTMQLVYQLEELVEPSKIRTVDGKAIAYGTGPGGIPSILGHKNNSPSVVSDDLVNGVQSRIRPQMLMSGSLFSRGDVGATKKLTLNRIYGQYMAKKDASGAKNFLTELFHMGKNIGTDDMPRRLLDYQTIEEGLELANGVRAEVLFKHMEKSGLTWGTSTIKAHAETFGVEYTEDKMVMSKRFDDLTMRMMGKDKLQQTGSMSVSNSTLLDRAVDNNHARFLRSVYNPYFNFVRNKIDHNHVTNGRYLDYVEIYRDGKKSTHAAIQSFSDVTNNINYITQQQATKSHNLKISSVIETQMQALQRSYTSTFEKTAIDRMIGRKKRGTKKTLLSVFSLLQGGDKLSGVTQGSTNLQEVNKMLTTTASYREYNKYYSVNGIAPDVTKDATKEFYHKAFLKNTIRDLGIEYQDERNKLDHAAPTEKEAILKNMDDIKLRMKGMRANFSSTGGNMATYDIENGVGTLFNKAFGSSSDYTFDDKDIGIKTKMAPNDLIIIKSKGFHMDDVFTEVRKRLNILDDELRANNPAAYKRRKLIDIVINNAERMTKLSGTSEGIILPNTHVLMDALGMGNKAITLGSTILQSDNRVIKAYENTLSSAMLTTLNEYENSKGSDYFNKRLTKSYATFLTTMADNLAGKKGLFSSDLEMKGNYGLLNSPFAFKYQVGDMVKDHDILRNNIRDRKIREYKKRGIYESTSKKHIDAAVQKEFELSLNLNEKIQSGRFNFVSRTEAMALPMNDSGLTLGKFLQKEVKDKRITRTEMREMMGGSRPLAFGVSRYPMDSNMHALFAGETYIYNDSWSMFKNSMKGTVPSLDTMLMMRADSDGDNIVTRVINAKNSEEMNQALKELRAYKTRRFEVMRTHQQFAFETGDFNKAREMTHKAYGGEFKASELNSITTLSTEILQEYKHAVRIHKNPNIGFSLGELQQEEIHKLSMYDFIDGTIEDFNKFTNPEDFKKMIRQKHMHFRSRLVGQSSVGHLASESAKFKAKMPLIMNRIKNINSPELQKQMLELFPGSRPGSEMDIDSFRKIMEETNEELTDNMYDLIRGLTHKGPEQKAMSVKKLTQNETIDHIFNLVNNVHQLDSSVARTSISALGVDLSEGLIKKQRFFNDIDKHLRLNDPVYNKQYHEATVDLTHNGKTPLDLLNLSLSTRFASGLENLSVGQMKDIAALVDHGGVASFASKTSSAWRDSVKQLLDMKVSKTVLGVGVGLSLLSLGHGDQMKGSVLDFGIDLGHKPGFDSHSTNTSQSFNPEPGQDIFTKKWTYLLKNDPVLKDNMDMLSVKDYKDLNMNPKIYKAPNVNKTYKRNYIDHRKKYNESYKTNDTRRAMIGM